MRKVECEEIRKINEVPKGEFIRCTSPKTGRVYETVYVKGDYCRERKAWECYKYEDVNSHVYLKANRQVLVGFTF